MKLYTYDMAPNPARLKMFMDYKGIEIETVQIDMAKLEQHTPEFVAINPEATLPTLVLEDGQTITAVIAIAHYLEALYPERPLLGVSALEKAMVLNWNHQLFNSVFMAAAEAFRNSHPAFKDRALTGRRPYPQIPDLAERGKLRLEDEFAKMNHLLETRLFVAGDFFSFADIDLLAAIEFARWGARTEPDSALSHLMDWRERANKALHPEH
jgi:glutathione S-transferase